MRSLPPARYPPTSSTSSSFRMRKRQRYTPTTPTWLATWPCSCVGCRCIGALQSRARLMERPQSIRQALRSSRERMRQQRQLPRLRRSQRQRQEPRACATPRSSCARSPAQYSSTPSSPPAAVPPSLQRRCMRHYKPLASVMLVALPPLPSRHCRTAR